MKKLILTFVVVLFISAVNAQKETYSVGILIDKVTPELTPLLNNLKKQVVSVVGEDAMIVFSEKNTLENNFDLQIAETNYKHLLNNDVDIIIAFGVVNSVVINKQIKHEKPTILFGAVNRDLVNLDLNKTTSGVENFTYLIESESYREDLQKFKELTNFKTVGIIIEQAYADLLDLKGVFNKELQQLKSNYKLIPFRTLEDITNNLNGIDAVYLAGGFFLNKSELDSLATVLIERKLPSFTITGIQDVESGLMATSQSDHNLNQFFRRIALNIESYVNGNSLATQPIYINYNSRLTVNYNTAKAVGVPIRYSLINNTDFIGEFKKTNSKKQYNLITAINDALDNNLLLQSSRKDVELVQQDIKVAKSSYLPSLSANASGTHIDPELAEISGGQSPEFSTEGNITLNQTLFSADANANIAIQKKLQKAQEENLNADQLDLIYDISNAYLSILISKANSKIQLLNLNLTKNNLLVAEQNYESGQSGQSDVLRFTSEKAQNTQSMVEAVNQLEQSYIFLNQLLNNPINEEIDVEDVVLDKGLFENYNFDIIAEVLDNPTLREPFIEFLIQEAIQNAPEIKSLKYNLEAVDRSIKLNGRGRFLPTLSLQGQYNRNFNQWGTGSTPKPDPRGNYNVGINVSIPIFDQNLNNINRATFAIQKDQLEINKSNSELAVSANIRNSVLNLVNELSNIKLSDVSLEAAQKSLELAQTSYESGAINIIELIDAQNNHRNAQLAKNNATYNYLINALQLERNLGYYFLLNSEEKNDGFRQRFLEFVGNKN